MYKKLFASSLLRCFKLSDITKQISAITFHKQNVNNIQGNSFHIYTHLSAKKETDKSTFGEGLVTQAYFANVKNKDRNTYLEMVKIFTERDVHRRGHVEFIYAALKHMKDFGVEKDLEIYKGLIDILPKGKFIPTNIFQSEFMHYPKQQQCIIDVLEQMEENGVIPDFELEDILINIFGRKAHPVRKYWRMMYWMPKFKNISPWPLPNPVPNDSLELAQLAMERMSSVDLQSEIVTYKTSDVPDSIDDTWIVSAQSPVQKDLLEAYPRNVPIYVEGAFRIWLRNASVNYYILRADPIPRPMPSPVNLDDVGCLKVPLKDEPENEVMLPPSVHEQDEGTILAMCATGTSSRDSLLSWIRLMEGDGNPSLGEVPVLFTLRSPTGEIISTEDTERKKVTD